MSLLTSENNFLVYNASAGSGKTFSLVKNFLKKILSEKDKSYYKHLLAITFTNKAVAEMKQRIITSLVEIKQEEVTGSAQEMLRQISQENNIPVLILKERAGIVLKHLLHNYAIFSVETIDHFNHRIIRTFARDLKLTSNFDVSLDSQLLLKKAVDNLIEKAGSDPEITDLLVAFALKKTENDTSWDILWDLLKGSQLILKENEARYLQSLSHKSLTDFKKLQKTLQKEEKTQSKIAVEAAEKLLAIFKENNLDPLLFQKYVYGFFSKIAKGQLHQKYKAVWQEKLSEKAIYLSKIAESDKDRIEALIPAVIESFNTIKTAANQVFLLENISKNLVPVATLSLIQQELDTLKKEENIVPIYEFNSLINNEIKEQPAPFIYERLGEKFRHFFIDEFQDTSFLQWQNLIPLIENSLSQEYATQQTGSLMLVGDAKQSIYRWRGGLPEQFIALCNTENPFLTSQKEVKTLDTNYRSCKEIINFNNSFFQFVATFFEDPLHKDLYKIGNQQKAHHTCEGFVEIQCIEEKLKADKYDAYKEKVYQIIVDLEHRNVPKKDICILTRKKEEGVALSLFLSQKNIPIISEETLLLQNSAVVRFLVNTFVFFHFPEDQENKLHFLDFLYDHIKVAQDKHLFLEQHLALSISELIISLQTFNLHIPKDIISKGSVFEVFEQLIHCFKLEKIELAYLVSFMECVFEYSKKSSTSIQEFLAYWEIEKEKASLSIASNQDAVKIMTIHKSKGLEFPVVLFPFAEIEIYKEFEPKAWYPLDKNGFEYLPINYSQGVSDYGAYGEALVKERKRTLELDQINLLYVVLTRAEKALYIITNNEKVEEQPKKISHFFKLYLEHKGIWNEGQLNYRFGKLPEFKSTPFTKITPTASINYKTFLPWEGSLKFITEDVTKKTIDELSRTDFGTLIHEILANVLTPKDIDNAIQKIQETQVLSGFKVSELKMIIEKIVTHPQLSMFFSENVKSYTEKEIISHNIIYRLDRLAILPNKDAVIIDYKSGATNTSHEQQINEYAVATEALGFKVIEKLIVYISKDTILVNKL